MPDEEERAQAKEPENVHMRELGTQSEIGGTAGEEHDRILERTLGHERGLDVAVKDGPPRPRAKKEGSGDARSP